MKKQLPEQEVIFDEVPCQNGLVGLITLNRPKALNVINSKMFKLIFGQLKYWESLADIKIVIIEGAGNRAFSAGGDIKALYSHLIQQENHDLPFFKDEYDLNKLIYHYRKPYISLLNGITMGGGAGLSIHGRWRIATEKFIFAMPETAIGFFPDIAAGHFLVNLPFRIGYYLGLTGNQIKSIDALALGLVDAVIPHEQLPLFRQDLFDASYSKNADGSIANIFTKYQTIPKRTELELLPKAPLVERYFDASSIEQIISNLKESKNLWCQEVATTLLKRCPISLKVTLKHLLHCEHLSFSSIIEENYCLSRNFLKHSDLREGIRATIIDKDHNPHWQPSNVHEVSEEMVNHFFE